MKIKKAVFVILASAIPVLLTGCFAINDAKVKYAESMAVLDVDYNGEVIRDLVYGDNPRNLYDLYLPEDVSGDGARHLILFIHGGSWTSGSKEDGEAYCRNYAAHGYTSASISYTLYEGDNTPTILTINQEVRAAVVAIEAKCAELGIMLSDMAVSGFSAGACQAMMYGFNTACAYEDVPVRFIIQMSGPTSFEPSIWRSSDVHWAVRKRTGLDGSREGDAAWISMFSGKTVTPDMVGTPEAEAVWDRVIDLLKTFPEVQRAHSPYVDFEAKKLSFSLVMDYGDRTREQDQLRIRKALCDAFPDMEIDVYFMIDF